MGCESKNSLNFNVSAYVFDDGLKQILPTHICTKIASLKPLSTRHDDFSKWKFSNNGFFTIKNSAL